MQSTRSALLPPITRGELEANFTNAEWRLDHLYFIVNEDGARVPFVLRDAQRRVLRGMHTRNVILKARQLGFSSFIQLFFLDYCLFHRDIRAGIIAHKRDDAGTIFRDKIKYAYNALPDLLKARIPATKNDAGELLLSNNSSIRVGTLFRSSTANLLHVSEYGYICAHYPGKAREIITGAIPAVHKRGFVFVESTAEGREGGFYEMSQQARHQADAGVPLSALDMKFWFFPWFRHPGYEMDADGVTIPQRLTDYFDGLETTLGISLTPEQRAWYYVTESGAAGLGEDILREHPSTPDEAFAQSIMGAYYKRQMDKAWADGRICSVPHDPELPVHTAWDLGVDDHQAIWFYQRAGDAVHLIDYLEDSGEGLGFYADRLREKGYRYGRHIGPHDIKVREWLTGKSRMESALSEYGIAFEAAPKLPMEDGIDAVRRTLPHCRFDESRCEDGIKALEGYRKEWDEDNGTYKRRPLHNRASHGADGFRALATSARLDDGVFLAGTGEVPGMKGGWFE